MENQFGDIIYIKKNITTTKSKDQHHTTLHSGQPWLGWGSPEEEEEGRFHKQEKQKHKKQSELKEKASKRIESWGNQYSLQGVSLSFGPRNVCDAWMTESKWLTVKGPIHYSELLYIVTVQMLDKYISKYSLNKGAWEQKCSPQEFSALYSMQDL